MKNFLFLIPFEYCCQGSSITTTVATWVAKRPRNQLQPGFPRPCWPRPLIIYYCQYSGSHQLLHSPTIRRVAPTMTPTVGLFKQARQVTLFWSNKLTRVHCVVSSYNHITTFYMIWWWCWLTIQGCDLECEHSPEWDITVCDWPVTMVILEPLVQPATPPLGEKY